MQVTSYFIAIDLKVEKLKLLFDKIDNFLEIKNLKKDIVLQNWETFHITLYYLKKSCNYKTIKEDLLNFEINKKIFIEDFSYFYRNKQEFICYLKPSNTKEYYNYNNFFKIKYKNFWADDNNLKFTPHISFFKIIKHKKFLIYKSEIENILKTEIKKLDKLNINSYSISIYGANSKIVPELQFKI